MKYILRVEYRNKETMETYTRDYDYNGETDKMRFKWVMDSDKLAYANCKENEDVMDYKLLEKGEE